MAVIRHPLGFKYKNLEPPAGYRALPDAPACNARNKFLRLAFVFEPLLRSTGSFSGVHSYIFYFQQNI